MIAAGGAHTTHEVTHEALDPRSVSAAEVVFGGEVDLRDTITGPKGSTPTQASITGPIRVMNDNGAWKVTTLSYGGAPMTYYPEGIEQTVRHIHLSVAFLLSSGTQTTALIALRAESPGVTVSLRSVVVTTDIGSRQAGRGVFGPRTPAGLFVFRRTTSRPARLDVSFQKGDGTTVAFSLALGGQPL